jgi:SWI/SNF-related matrix-associated actin-dependent regulator of chromatin subfamily A3
MCSIPRDVAAVLAPLLDSGTIKIEGTVMGTSNTYVIPISIQLFAPQASAQRVLPQLMSRFDLRDGPVRPGYNPPRVVRQPPPPPPSQERQYVSSSPASSQGIRGPTYDALLQTSIAFNPRSLRDAPEKFGLSMKDLEALPLAKQPPQVKTKMLPYQLQGLAWLMNMEHPKLPTGDEVRQFWTKKGPTYFNIATH